MIGPVLLTIVAGVLTIVFWCIKQKQKYKCLDFIPGKKPLPILGNALDLGMDPIRQLKGLMQMREEYGPVFKLWVGPNNVLVFISEAEMTEFFLSAPKYINKSFGYDLFYPWLGQGLLTSNGSHWHKKRKLITPTFHFKILEQFVPIFHKAGSTFVKILSQKVGDQSVNLYEYIKRYTLDIICETAMGTSVNSQGNTDHEYVKAVNSECKIIIQRLFSIWMRVDFLFQFSSSSKIQDKSLNILHGFVKSVVEKRRQELLNSDAAVDTETHVDIGAKKRIAFLDLLLQTTLDGRPLTNEEICEEVDTFMFEGHDTTSSGILFAFYEMAKNLDMQTKILEEVVSILGTDKTTKPTLENLNAMKYTELFLKEVMRLYPSVPYIARTLDHDVTYKENLFPKGTTLFFFNYSMQRDPKYFENPDKFNPYRFMKATSNKNTFNYIPFSAGPRNCIGKKFAMFEMKFALVDIVRNFELSLTEPNKKLVLATELILKPAEDILFQLKERT